MRRKDVTHGNVLHHKITDANLRIMGQCPVGAFAQETGMTPRLYYWGELFKYWNTKKRKVAA